MMASIDLMPMIIDSIENVKNDNSLSQSEKEEKLKFFEKAIEDRQKFEKKVSIAYGLIFLFATIATIGEIFMWCINLHS